MKRRPYGLEGLDKRQVRRWKRRNRYFEVPLTTTIKPEDVFGRYVPDTGQKCYCCGQHEMVWVTHKDSDASISMSALDDEEIVGKRTHLYCRNCDNGVCELC